MGFRRRLIERNLDRRLVERTVELAARTGGFGARALRAALDSSPLWGAGRVEDTFNLMGHALRKALGVIAVLQGRGQAAGTAVVAATAAAALLALLPDLFHGTVGFQQFGYRFSIDALSKEGFMPPEAFTALVEQLTSQKSIDEAASKKVPVTAYFDNRYVNELEKEGFFKKLWGK